MAPYNWKQDVGPGAQEENNNKRREEVQDAEDIIKILDDVIPRALKNRLVMQESDIRPLASGFKHYDNKKARIEAIDRSSSSSSNEDKGRDKVDLSAELDAITNKIKQSMGAGN